MLPSRRRESSESAPRSALPATLSAAPVGAEHAHLLAAFPQPGDRAAHGGVLAGALEVGEEHVVAEADPTRARLDPRQADVAVGELGETAHEPARRAVAGAPEDDRGLRLAAAAQAR